MISDQFFFLFFSFANTRPPIYLFLPSLFSFHFFPRSLSPSLYMLTELQILFKTTMTEQH